MDLIREILLKIEAAPPATDLSDSDFQDQEYELIHAHLELLSEADLVKVTFYSGGGYAIHRLTWDGHEYLDTIRDPSIWKTVRGKAAAFGGSLPFEVLKALGIEALKSAVGLRG
jgi:hypothetical protein